MSTNELYCLCGAFVLSIELSKKRRNVLKLITSCHREVADILSMSNSDSEDDPRNTSDEEWTARPKKKNTNLRKSVRLIKKAKTYTSSEDDCSLVQNVKVHRNGVKKKKQPAQINPNKHNVFVEMTRTPVQAPSTFTSGAFVVAKHDAQSYDAGTPPHIWRIDGKALLQKFEPMSFDTELRYKNTSVYTGWSEIETDNYAVLKNINFIYNTPQRVEITLNVDEFKNILTERNEREERIIT